MAFLPATQAPLSLDSEARRSIFYLKTDIALPDCVLRKLAQEASRTLAVRRAAVEELGRQLGFHGQASPVAAGSYHVIHRLDRSNAPSLVVRSTVHGIFERDSGLQLEAKVAEWLGPQRGLVPATLATGFRTDGAPFDYAVLSFAAGKTIRDVGDSSLDERPEILNAIGRQLSRIHEVQATGAGLINCETAEPSPCGVLGTWSEFITLRLDDHINVCTSAAYIDRAQADRIRKLFKIMYPLLNDRPMRLLHGDPGIHNICINPTSGEVTSFLDWEDALAGDPLFDVAMFSSFQPPRRLPAFMVGYGLNNPSLLESRLIALYFLRIALSKTVHRLRFDVKDKPGREPGHYRIYRGLSELERLL